MKNVCGNFQEIVKHCGKEDSLFHLQKKEHISEIISPSMTKHFFNGCYEEIIKKGMGSFHRREVCSEGKQGLICGVCTKV